MMRSSKDVYTVVEHIVMQKVDRRMESVHTVVIQNREKEVSVYTPSPTQTPGQALIAWAGSSRR